MRLYTSARTGRIINLPIRSMFRALFLTLLLLGLGCKSQEKGKTEDAADRVQSQELTLLVADNYGGSEVPHFQVIRDMKTLELFFGQVNKTRKPALPVPQVDFSKELVILHCPGKRMNGGTPGLMIQENTPEKIVFVQEDKELEQKAGIEALTMPFSLYKLPLTGKEISFVKEN